MAQSILIVDDNEQDRYLLKRQLKKLNIDCVVIEKEDGEEALDFFSTAKEEEAVPEGYPPDVIFLDINMPLVGGFEFLEKFSELRRQVDAGSTVVLMCTSSEREEEKQKAMSYDFVDGYILKGKTTAEELEVYIQKALKR